MAFVLAYELNRLVEAHGVENCGFLTLTFGDRTPPSIKEVQRRYNSLRTGVLAERYPRAIGVVERGETRRRLHMHLVLVLGFDIRTGFDFEACLRRDYRSANLALRNEWAFWRATAPKYGFGRTELLPIKSNAEGIARYVGSYIKKHLMHREDEDKGARLVRFMNYGPGDRKASTRLAWNSEGAWLWRAKVEAWAKRLRIESYDELLKRCGSRWAYHFKEDILGTAVGAVHPSHATAMESWSLHTAAEFRRFQAKEAHEKERGQAVTGSYVLERNATWGPEERPF